jgi:hypothetical protein
MSGAALSPAREEGRSRLLSDGVNPSRPDAIVRAHIFARTMTAELRDRTGALPSSSALSRMASRWLPAVCRAVPIARHADNAGARLILAWTVGSRAPASCGPRPSSSGCSLLINLDPVSIGRSARSASLASTAHVSTTRGACIHRSQRRSAVGYRNEPGPRVGACSACSRAPLPSPCGCLRLGCSGRPRAVHNRRIMQRVGGADPHAPAAAFVSATTRPGALNYGFHREVFYVWFIPG